MNLICGLNTRDKRTEIAKQGSKNTSAPGSIEILGKNDIASGSLGRGKNQFASKRAEKIQRPLKVEAAHGGLPEGSERSISREKKLGGRLVLHEEPFEMLIDSRDADKAANVNKDAHEGQLCAL